MQVTWQKDVGAGRLKDLAYLLEQEAVCCCCASGEIILIHANSLELEEVHFQLNTGHIAPAARHIALLAHP